MKSLIPALLSVLAMLPASAFADDANAPQGRGCGMADSALINQGSGTVMISCVGVSAEFGSQLAGILTYVLQRRLDPEIVIAKLDEVSGVPDANVARNLTTEQGQAIVQSLMTSGKPATIAINADPGEPDAANYALAIATRLGMAGWQIAGSQINRAVPAGLEDIHGVVLVVHDEKKPPAMADELKKAMAAAKVFVPIISRDSVGPDEAMLWVGKRAQLNAAETQ
ncbi:MAG TPA: hypothetical protein VNV38_16745 [Stellaceae bacterium]|jgi:hypothetical protein|nr:hypothetical protein [Stellaceae bacterium]